MRVELLEGRFAPATITGSTGPGGFEATAGASSMALWFDAASLNLVDGTPMASWSNSSAVIGAGAAGAQSTVSLQPTFESDAASLINSNPVVRFDGVNDFLQGIVSATAEKTFYLVSKSTGAPATCCSGGIMTQNGGSANSNGLEVVASGGVRMFVDFPGGGFNGTSEALNITNVAAATYASTGTALFVNGTTEGSNAADWARTGNLFQLGTRSNEFGRFFKGDMAEAVMFNRVLTLAERQIVDSALGAKYGVTTIANDRYSGDAPGINYDFGVFGIGRTGAGSEVLSAGQAGFGLEATSLTDGVFVMAGHSGAASYLSNQDLPGGVTSRWNRSWFVDKTGATSGTTLAFDFTDSGQAAPGGSPTYTLLYRSSLLAPFTTVAATATVVGDTVKFTLGDAALVDGHYTLGTNLPPDIASITANTGPGGVGTSASASSPDLVLWLKSDSITGVADGANVSAWNNSVTSAGRAGDATVANTAPTLENAGADLKNGNPVVSFSGWSGTAGVGDVMSGTGTFAANKTMFFVGQQRTVSASSNCCQGGISTGIDQNGLVPNGATGNWSTDWPGGGTNAGSPNKLGSWSVVSGAYDSGTTFTGTRVWVDGAGSFTNSATPQGIAAADYRLGARRNDGDNFAGVNRFFDGNIGETVIYNSVLNNAQRILVENALSAKWDVPLTANDLYAGDTGGNGDYDLDVFGIGRTAAGSEWLASGQSGFGIGTLALNDGAFVIAGHNSPFNSLTGSDVPGGVTTRWNRSWYVQKTGVTTTTQLSFDFTDSGLVVPSGSPTYQLLYRATTSSPFSVVAGATVAVSGDAVKFTLSDANLLTGYYTLGSSIPVPTVAPIVTGGTGPGGVGTVATASSTGLELWLKAESITGVADGGNITAWNNSVTRAGAAGPATVVNTAPTHENAAGDLKNNLPVVSFSGVASNTVGDVIAGSGTFTANKTIFLIAQQRTVAPASCCQGGISTGSDSNGVGLTGNTYFTDWGGAGNNIGSPNKLGAWGVVSGLYDNGTFFSGTRLWVDGAGFYTNSATPQGVAASDYRLGARQNTGDNLGRFFDGNIGEAVVYNSVLNSAQRTVVENALSSKWDIALTTGDYYDGDTAGKGNYDLDVFGIGSLDAANQLLSGGAAGFGLSAVGGLAPGSVEFLMAGRKATAATIVTSNLPSGVDKRWNSVMYVDKTGNVDAALSFDFSDAGLGAIPASTIGYRLLYSPTNSFESTSAAFTAINATAVVNGDTITFTLPNGQLLDGYYTLGLLDATAVLQADSAAAGNGAADALRIVKNGANVDFYVNGTLVRSSALASLTSISVVGSTDSDTFIVDSSGGNPLPTGGVNYSGGAGGGFDSLTLTGGSATTIAYSFINENDGSVAIDGRTVNYIGLEPVIDNMNAVNRSFTFTGGAETIAITDAGGGFTRINSTLGELVDFVAPTTSLSVITNGGDTVNITAFAAGFATPLIVFQDTTGATAINQTIANALPDASSISLIGTVTLNISGSDTIGSLTGYGNVAIAGGQTLSTGNDNTNTIFGGIISGAGALAKIGSGFFMVAGNNTYTGATTVSAGKLSIASYGSIANASTITVASAGTLAIGQAINTNNIVLNGGLLAAEGDNAGTGGTMTTRGNNVIHTFTRQDPQTLVLPVAVTANVLIVAGGGGGGGGTGGGGGAGGALVNPAAVIPAGANAVTVGAGGVGGSGTGSPGTNGSNSVLGSLIAIGGGGGGNNNSNAGLAGGSGGGAGANGAGSGGAGTVGQGNAGGINGANGGNYPTGGGGGAGAVGGNGIGSTTAGNGGIGLLSSITGTSTYYAGGGGGGVFSGGGTPGTGGLGGGGSGGSDVVLVTSGQPNTGGGGGGQGNNNGAPAGSGGSGIVVVSIPLAAARAFVTLAGTITLGAATTSTLDALGAGGRLTITGNLTGTGNVTFASSAASGGVVSINGATSYVGATGVAANTKLILADTGSISLASVITVNAGSTFAIGQATNANTIIMNGGTLIAEADNLGSGGGVTIRNGNVIHTLTASGSLYVPTAETARALVIAGGGGGGGSTGGGGGAGGLLTNAALAIPAGTTAVTVGAGGAGGAGAVNGGSGGSSSLLSLTAIGGGGGGFNDADGLPGGSGGGGSFTSIGGLGTVGQGFNGGASATGAGIYPTAGGGGAGGAGGNAVGTGTSGNGGIGVLSNISGADAYYAGGGGGGTFSGGTNGVGGIGGGGNGGLGNGGAGVFLATAGAPGTGSGGGGQGSNNASSTGGGGSGVVIVSYPLATRRISATLTGAISFATGSTSTFDALGAGGQFILTGTVTGLGAINIASSTTAGGVVNLMVHAGYTGATNLNSGKLAIASFASIPLASTITVASAGTLAIGQTTNTNTIVLNGGTIIAEGDNGGGGGAISYVGGNVIHKFTYIPVDSQSLLLTGPETASVLVVAGGGGGGGSTGGGGGAGGFLTGSSVAIAAGLSPVTVGKGGNGGTIGVHGQSGGNSAFGSFTAIGGGGGGYNGVNGNSGGSGGGGSFSATGGAGTLGQGSVGGASAFGAGIYPTAGGGGAGGVGGNALSASVAGNGGVGLVSSITGTPTFYAGGGGGGTYSGGTAGVGGLGGGGNGGLGNGAGASAGLTSGAPDTGGGGGGQGGNSGLAAGSGGTGVVIVSYPLATRRTSVTLAGNITLNSGSSTLDALGAGGQFIVTGTVTGGGAVNIASSAATGGVVAVAANLGYVGATNVNSGKLALTSFGSIANASTITVNAAGTLAIGQTTNSNTIVLNSGTILAETDNHGTGGTITIRDNNIIHSFTTVGAQSLVMPQAVTANVLVVAGGGGGGGSTGGGGGAGGYVTNTALSVASGATTVAVGAGGAGGAGVRGTSGQNSVLGSLTAIGGGGGGTNNDLVGLAGGSGGGNGANSNLSAGLGTPGQGNNGGIDGDNGGNYPSGGGGGAGGVGGNGSGPSIAGNGGVGLFNSITGLPTQYAGGGGGGTYFGGTAGLGGAGGGGNGAGPLGGPTSGQPNTGGGGGGQRNNDGAAAGAGGSGVVIVAYPLGTKRNIATLTGNITVNSGTSTLDALGAGGQLTLAGSVTGAGGVNVVSSSAAGGVVTLASAAGYTGATTVNSGKLAIASTGSIATASTVTVNASGTLAVGQVVNSNSIVLNSGVIVSENNNLPISATLRGPINFASGTSTLDALGVGGRLTVTGAVTGPGAVTIVSSSGAGGVVAMATAAGYSGATTVNSGKLAITSFGSIATASTITVNAAGTLAIGQATNSNNIILNSGTILAEGDNAGVGGAITSVGGNVIHAFTTVGAQSLVLQGAETANVLVVAGGGGGGGGTGGGGGAGGYLANGAFALGAGTTPVTVGGGGVGGAGTGAAGVNGSNSILGSLTAIGGGGGGHNNSNPGLAGGSGGGAGANGGGPGGAGTVGQGNAGGLNGSNGGNYPTGGGGGAGAVGGNGVGSVTSGNGGVGLANSITGVSSFYAGGGGGGIFATTLGAGAGGLGGGGNGGATSLLATNGQPNTGGGGGGQGNNDGTPAGTGGSGVVIVSYPMITRRTSATLTGNITFNSGTSTLDALGAGGQLTLTGAVTGGGAVTVASSAAAGGVAVFQGSGITYAGGTTIAAGTLRLTDTTAYASPTIANAAALVVDQTAGTAAIGSIVSGPGTLTKTGAGTASLAGGNTYTGATTLSAGVLSVGDLANGGSPSGIGQSTSAPANLVFDGGTLRYTGADASTNRDFAIVAGKSATLDIVTAATDLTLSGVSPATTGGLTKTGLGTLVLGGANLYTGVTTINQGTLLVSGSLANGPATPDVIVSASGTLGGTGTIAGSVQVNTGGAVAPGVTTGVLSTGDVVFAASSFFNVDIVASAFDQLSVNGSVALGNARLIINPASTPTAAPYVIVNNNLADPITGIFAKPDGTPLPEGAEVGTFGGVTLFITYNGGDGNDVELTDGPVVNGTGGNDTLIVRQSNATHIEYSFNGGAFTPILSTLVLTFNGQGGIDQLLVDLATASPFNGDVMFNGESIRVQGTGATASFLPDDVNNKIHASAGFVNYSGTTSIDFVGLLNASADADSGAITLQTGATTVAAGAVYHAGYAPVSQPALAATGLGGLAVRFVGNTLSNIETGYGVGDTITVAAAGAVIDGPLALTADMIGGTGVLTAPNLNATAFSGITLNTNVTSLSALTLDLTANIVISETNAINLIDVDTSGGSVTINAGGDINVGYVGAMDSSVSLQVTGVNGSILDLDNDPGVDIDAPFGITLVAKGTGTIGTSTNALELGSYDLSMIDALSAQTDNQDLFLGVPAGEGDVRILKLNTVLGGGLVPAGSSGNITLTAGANVAMDSSALGGGADIVGDLVSLTAAGDLGQNAEPLELNAITLVTNSITGGPLDGAQFLAEADSVVIGLNGLNPGNASANLERLGVGTAIYNFTSGDSINDLALLNLADGVQVVLGSDEMLGALGDYPGHVAAAGFAEILFAGRTLSVGANGNDSSYSGILAGAGGQFEKLGVGRFTEIDGGVNTYTGLTTVENGVLALAKTGGGGKAIVGPIMIGDSVGAIGSAVLEIAADEQILDTAAIAFTGIDGRLLSAVGTIETITTPTDFAQGDVKIAGLLITTNAYAQPSGSTTLSGGVLRVGALGTLNSSLGTSLTPGGTLQGSGTIYTNILTSWGTIDPSSGLTDADVGNQSPGRVNIRGNLQLTTSSITNLDVASSGSDQLNVGINIALPLPAGSYSVLSNYDLDPYLRGDVASVTEQARRGINNVNNINGTVRFNGTLNTRPIVGSTPLNNATYGNSMNFVWRALNLPMGSSHGDLNPKAGNLSSLPSDFTAKNSLDVNGLPTLGTRFDQRYMGSGGQLNAVGQSVGGMTKFGAVDTALLTAPAYLVGQAKSLTLTSLTSSAVVDADVKVTKQSWNAMKDSHTRVTLTVGNTGATTVTGPFYVEVISMPANATVFNAAGKRPSTTRPYLVVPVMSLAPGAAITMELDLLTPVALGKTATIVTQVLRGGMP